MSNLGPQFDQAAFEHALAHPKKEPTVTCDFCGDEHPATYHHNGSHGEGPLYEVTCDKDGLADYYTEWRLNKP